MSPRRSCRRWSRISRPSNKPPFGPWAAVRGPVFAIKDRPVQDRLKRLAVTTGWIARIALWVAGAGLVLMTALIAAQVVWRYGLNDSIAWTEPASVMIMGWFIFLGAAVGIREGYHLSF